MTQPLDPRIVATLEFRKPCELSKPAEDYVEYRAGIYCRECFIMFDGYPCRTATALGVPGEHLSAETLLEALTWWWQAHGLDEEAARVAAALEQSGGASHPSNEVNS